MAFKMRGFSAFTKKDEYKPQTETRKNIVEDKTPQLRDIGALEGQIEGIYDNEYVEARENGDKKAMLKYENQMLKLKQRIANMGENYTHIDMSNFGKK